MKTATFCLVAICMLVSSSVMAERKFGYVDLQLALNDVEEGQKAKKKLERLFRKRQKELDAKQKNLKKMKGQFDSEIEELKKQAPLLKPEVRQRKQEELVSRQREMERKYIELQQSLMNNQKELAEKEREYIQPILEKLQKVTEVLGKQQGYYMVLHSSAIVFGPAGSDLTAQVVKAYNAQRKSGSRPKGGKKK